MITAPFAYHRAASVDEALDLLLTHGTDARLLAGGHSLLPSMKLRQVTPGVLVDIAALPGLRGVRQDGDVIEIGALTRFADLVTNSLVRANVPLLGQAASLVGDRQVRHRGTIGGSLAHADPAADVPAVVLACGGELVVRGPGGARRIPASEFFQGRHKTALLANEMITAVRVARHERWSYERFTLRALDWALVGVAVADRAIVLVNLADRPIHATATETALRHGADIEQAASLAAGNAQPGDDPRASADYRRHLARVLTGRALRRAAGGRP